MTSKSTVMRRGWLLECLIVSRGRPKVLGIEEGVCYLLPLGTLGKGLDMCVTTGGLAPQIGTRVRQLTSRCNCDRTVLSRFTCFILKGGPRPLGAPGPLALPRLGRTICRHFKMGSAAKLGGGNRFGLTIDNVNGLGCNQGRD